MKKIAFFFLVLGAVSAIRAAEAPQKKTLVEAGKFIRIYDPSVGEKEKWYINDHCFIRGNDGLWRLYGITHQEEADPMNEHVFAHATAEKLLQRPWDKRPFALTVAEQSPWREEHLWAPCVVFHDGTYYMFYCAGDKDHAKYKIHLATSKDLKHWTRHPKNPMVVDGFDARDPFVMRHDGKWLMYYTATSEPEGGNHVVACVSSPDLITWGDKKVVYTDRATGTFGGPTESPFVVRRGKNFYLFVGPRPDYNGTDVFVSDDPFHWDFKDKVGHIPSHAAEVIRDADGKWYVSRCGWGQGGVYLAPLTWNDGLDDAETNMPIPKDEANHPDSTTWENLFEQDLSNAIAPAGVWAFRDGVLSPAEDQNIWTKKEYDNFILDLEFKNEPGTNSGVLVYGSDVENWIPRSVEVQIADDHAKVWADHPATWHCGAIFGRLAPEKSTVHKPGQWNRMTVTCRGPEIRVVLNGQLVTRMDMRKWTSATKNPDGSQIPPWLNKPLAEIPTRGHIGLQGKHGGVPIYFRNIKIKKIAE